MVRPRRDEQQVLIDRVGLALANRVSLRPWTLAEIAPAVGLSPAGLSKRFGSRKGLLLALSRRWIESIPEAPIGAEAPVQELRTWVTTRFGAPDPDAVAAGLVNLLDDLADEELRGLLAQGWAKEIAYLGSLLAAMDLPRMTAAPRAARLLFDALNGAMLRGATHDPTTVGTTIDDLLEAWE